MLEREIIFFIFENNSISHEVIAQHFSIEWNIRLVRSTVSGIVYADENYTICRSLGAKRMRSMPLLMVT
jgi:hypothetical protein